MGLGGGDPLGGGHLEEVYIELRAKADKLRQDLHTGMDGVMQELEQQASSSTNPLQSVIGGIFSIGDAAEVAIGNLAVTAFTTLISTIEKVIGLVANLAYNFVASGVQLNASLQQMNIAFTTILGSQQAANTFMTKLREEAAAFGGGLEVLQAGKSLVPYAEGDINKFNKLLTIAKQLAVIDPVQGFKGAGFALREALSGQVLSLSSRFELPKKELNELKKEFAETGDLDKFMDGLSELIGRFGATAESVEAMSNTAQAGFAKIQFQITELQRVAGAPILASLQKHMNEFSTMFGANMTSLKDVALTFGAVIAVMIDELVETANVVFFAFNKLSEYFDDFRTKVATALSDVAGLFVSFWANVFNIKINIDDFKKNVADVVKIGLGGSKEFSDMFNIPESDFAKRVQAYRDMFSDLIDASDQGWDQLGNTNKQGQQDDAAQWVEYLQKLQSIIEDGNKSIEKAEQDHQEKLDNIIENADKARSKAGQKYDEDVEKTKEDANQKRQEEAIQYNQKLEDIEKEHARKIQEIRNNTEEQLFDAVNARDAKRVNQILQNAKKERTSADRDRNNQREDAKIAHDREMQDIERQKDEKLNSLKDGLAKQLEEIQINQNEQRDAENKAYDKRLKDLHDSIQSRLKTIARGWAEEGKITKEGLQTIMELATKVFGPSGDYIALLQGFNSALTAQVLQAINTMGKMPGGGSGGGSGSQNVVGGTPVGKNPGEPGYDPRTDATLKQEWMTEKAQGEYTGSFLQWLKDHGYISAEFGYDGVINKPTMFLAGEKFKPERISITPMNSSFNKSENSDYSKYDIHITADGVSKEFEAQIATQLSTLLNESIKARRYKRG